MEEGDGGNLSAWVRSSGGRQLLALTGCAAAVQVLLSLFALQRATLVATDNS